ncbi:peptidoglycan DD-metalloendopeptidase family protein [Pseudoalteromonas sp. P94(2023)]|uniref:Peptidoglycan DD-metalloendopeptidase family protein n=1 Tax=Pseudoalteromonas obscura TaxID=3048491 RepID=A0ABT7ETZ8_9GAMM|nr:MULTISPECIES: peptidoglycan DD-metalloendopeptidase family protein [Pseudoalteromonas]MBQ4839080.1 peptidoglycan DD-metalloendopeptidase family protein [Pseudoalteromonas luteoviolacea]MDK2598516.1 peptidoglycan DD-metalloendopeptidase family protein [Pseudoalteromonas sp. P94(2023)]
MWVRRSNFLIVGLLCSSLVACSSVHTPAPVVNLSKGKTTSSKKIHIKNNRYKVKKGDTLFSIAFSANKDIRTVAKINKIKPPYTIYPGQTILLTYPKKSNKTAKKTPLKTKKYTTNKPLNNKPSKKELDPPKQREYVQSQASKKTNDTSTLLNKKVRWNWPAVGKVTRRFSIKENGYKGIQITNKTGTSIKAAASGIVVYAGSALRGYGNLIILKHTDDYLSAYAHNSKLLVREQQQVKVGQKIAEMGSSDASSVALRFEVRYRGKSVDPIRYLPKK